ncbi:MAG: nitroreductase family protein [Rhodobacteraceae bacterium]|nr:nitroreductase family protein [Paracoccaceae bacterium]
MSVTSPAALAFLLARRSHPARTLRPPAPAGAELDVLLTAAARAPDHGKLVPWRFVVLDRPALARLAAAVPARGEELGVEPDRVAKMRAQLAEAPLVVAVVAAPRADPRIPEIEQILSAGAVCLGLLNAALAAGWGAAWVTGWVVHDRPFRERHLGLGAGEFVAGMVHIGTASQTPPDRPRPDLAGIVTRAPA